MEEGKEPEVFEVRYNTSEYSAFPRIILALFFAPVIGVFAYVFLGFFILNLSSLQGVGTLVAAITLFSVYMSYPFMLFVGLPTILLCEYLYKKHGLRNFYIFLIYVALGFIAPMIFTNFVGKRSSIQVDVIFALNGVAVAAMSYLFVFCGRKRPSKDNKEAQIL